VHPRVHWPDGRRFAFSIFDDTDNATVDNVLPVYDLLADLGVLITKSVWPLPSDRNDPSWGQCLEDSDYLEMIRSLASRGFEIAFHGARSGVNPRSVTLEALDAFRAQLGHDPRSFAHHARNIENLYWGAKRCNISAFKPLVRSVSQRPEFFGDVEGSEFYWADLCRERIEYVRNFGFRQFDIFENSPHDPYHDPRRPMVNSWFSTSYGLTPSNADEILSDRRIREWGETGALVILSTHFAHGFVKNGHVSRSFGVGFERLAASGGWFAPVSSVLDHVVATRGKHEVSLGEAIALEVRWARDQGAKVAKRRLRSTVRGLGRST
jgi:hypothetical protein